MVRMTARSMLALRMSQDALQAYFKDDELEIISFDIDLKEGARSENSVADAMLTVLVYSPKINGLYSGNVFAYIKRESDDEWHSYATAIGYLGQDEQDLCPLDHVDGGELEEFPYNRFWFGAHPTDQHPACLANEPLPLRQTRSVPPFLISD